MIGVSEFLLSDISPDPLVGKIITVYKPNEG